MELAERGGPGHIGVGPIRRAEDIYAVARPPGECHARQRHQQQHQIHQHVPPYRRLLKCATVLRPVPELRDGPQRAHGHQGENADADGRVPLHDSLTVDVPLPQDIEERAGQLKDDQNRDEPVQASRDAAVVAG